MNLLIDNWIPVQENGVFRLISLDSVLCRDEEWQIALSRDDMEMACLQLLISLTQVLFLPDDEKSLKKRIRQPLSNENYHAGIVDYMDWFDLNHPDTPFMQTRGVEAKQSTPIQKMFIGLPEGNNHAFFNEPGEVGAVSPSAAVIALFNQAMNCPNFGGGFKGGFRGGAPVTTFVSGKSLRQTIWFNVLHKKSVQKIIPGYEKSKERDKPVWVEPIKSGKISATAIGLLRGMFWQPAHIELEFIQNKGVCSFYGTPAQETVSGFKKEKFVYDIIGNWIHPYSPRSIDLEEMTVQYLSFRTAAPAWTQLSRFVVEEQGEREGHFPSAVISQFREMAGGRPIHMMVGGYRNKQAAILERRHEFFSLTAGWDEGVQDLAMFIEKAIEIKTLLRNKLFGFAKTTGAGKIHEVAELLFYNNSESLIHASLRQMEWRESAITIRAMQEKLMGLSWRILNEVTRPYRHEPKMIRAMAVSRRSLGKAFSKLKEGWDEWK